MNSGNIDLPIMKNPVFPGAGKHHRIFSRSLLVVFIVIAAFQSSKIIQLFYAEPVRPCDFINIYLGSKLISKKTDPYNDHEAKSLWNQTDLAQHLKRDYQPGYPGNPVLYPPWSLALLMPISSIPYSCAYKIWYVFIGCCMVMSIVLFAKVFSCFFGDPVHLFVELSVLALAFKGTVNAIIVGQPTFLALLGIAASLYWYKRNIPLAEGAALFLAAFKITLGIPVLAFFLFKKRFLSVGICLLLILMFSAVGCYYRPDIFVRYGNAISGFRDAFFDIGNPHYQLSLAITSTTEVGAILIFIFKNASMVTGVYAILFPMMAGYLVFLFYKKKISDLYLLVAANLIVSSVVYFRLHDLVFLMICLFVYASTASKPVKTIIFLVNAMNFIPTNKIVMLLWPDSPLSFFMFTQPVMTALNCALFFLLPFLPENHRKQKLLGEVSGA